MFNKSSGRTTTNNFTEEDGVHHKFICSIPKCSKNFGLSTKEMILPPPNEFTLIVEVPLRTSQVGITDQPLFSGASV